MRNNTHKDDLSDWLTTNQAARLLGVTSRRVLQLIDENLLEAQKVNPRLYLVKRESVEEYRATLG